MTNHSIGDELDRYAAVNDMFLKMDDSESLDVSYHGYVEFMKETNWNSPIAEGGKYSCSPSWILSCIEDSCHIDP